MTPDPLTPFDNAQLRAGDADRERVAEQLRRAHGEGRIDDDELADRLGRCYAAQTFGELHELTVDLGSIEHREPRRIGERRRPRGRVRFVLIGLLALWALSGAAHAHAHASWFAFWIVVVVAFAVVQLVRAVRT